MQRIVTRAAVAAGRGLVLAVGALSLLASAGAQAVTTAGEVVNVAGRAAAATSEGDIRALEKGGGIHSGETVVTSAHSYVRLKFVDGAYVILRPNTRFQIEDYNFSETAAENRSLFNLVKGGFRTVTGLIGKRNRPGYRVRTAVATIGIRGTDFEARDCAQGSCVDSPDGTYVRVHAALEGDRDGGAGGDDDEGEGGDEACDEDGCGGITVENDAGEKDYDEGEYGYVADQGTDPVEIDESAADPLVDEPLGPADCGG